MSTFEERGRAVYVISVAAELAGMHPQTLRGWERKGLVQPGRSRGGSRRYSEIDVERLRRIQDLTNAGHNLEGVRRILQLEDEIARLEAENARLRELHEQVVRQYRREIVPFSTSTTFLQWGGRREG